jgi:protein-tyrosine phosphatase
MKYGIVAVCLPAILPSTVLASAFVTTKRHSTPAATTADQHSSTTLLRAMKGPLAQPPRPNRCTYWVSENLMAGEHPTAKRRDKELSRAKLSKYLDAGISVFVDLTEEGQKLDYEAMVKEIGQEKGFTIEYHRLAVPDFGIPSVPLMREILDTIDEAVKRNKKVYVHCAGGIGRTGTTVGCYLVRHGNDGKSALQEVNRLFQNSDRSMESYTSPETREQMKFVQDWDESS